MLTVKNTKQCNIKHSIILFYVSFDVINFNQNKTVSTIQEKYNL